MPYTKDDLSTKHSLSLEDVEKTIQVLCISLDRDPYTDKEEDDFDIVRGYFRSGLATTYEQAAELFKASQNEVKKTSSSNSPKKQLKSKGVSADVESNGTHQNPAPSEETFDFTDLLVSASEQLGIRIKLTEGVQVLSACGLPDKELYTQSECDRFIGACAALSQNGQVNIEDSIVAAASASESGFVGIADRITSERAQSLPGLVNQLYMKNAAIALNDSQEDIQGMWSEMEGRILAKIEGKSIIPQILGREWKPNSLNASSAKPMKQASVSESELMSESPEKSLTNDEP
ncbi:MAG: hypothetical protein H0X31_00360 [Nostocaceae cyanobacterium]|nr:hypothetical protein [Nostocaceae cyanobacterium]